MKLFCDTEPTASLQNSLKEVSEALQVVLVDKKPEAENHLSFSGRGLAYWDVELGELHLDFLNDFVNYSRKSHKGKSELIAKAVGLPKGVEDVFDATLGLAQDAWFLAQLGARVSGCERSPALYILLKDALARAKVEFPQVPLQIYFADSIEFLKNSSLKPTVVYVDPMFPEKKKSALPRKEMRIFRKLVGDDMDAMELLETALQQARERVVVKRPVKAAPLLALQSRIPVIHTFEGKTVRYDLYSTKMERLV